MHGYTFLILLENQAKKIILLISLIAALLSLPILEWSSGSSSNFCLVHLKWYLLHMLN